MSKLPDQHQKHTAATAFEQCPKCNKYTATSQRLADGTGQFYCTAKPCGFQLITHKQDMADTRNTLSHIKQVLFSIKK